MNIWATDVAFGSEHVLSTLVANGVKPGVDLIMTLSLLVQPLQRRCTNDIDKVAEMSRSS